MKREHDTLGRRNRMRANPTGKRIRLSGRDETWLEAIHRHGPLSSSFLLAFAKSLGSSEKRARERLGDLFHESDTGHGGAYLTRPPQQFQTIDSRYNQLVYDLTSAGKQALIETAKWSDRSGPNGGPWWHKFMVSSITASVELATMERSDVSYISQSRILDRAGKQLDSMIEYLDPTSKKMVRKKLCPDALFGLEYHTEAGSRFRFFAVEADRSTEPMVSRHANRKSLQRNLAGYEQYIGRGLYKRHLKLTAPLLLLTVTTNEKRRNNMLECAARFDQSLAAALLFQHWECFEQPCRVPKINTEFLNGEWLRAGLPAVQID